jgi:hypothetical protein
MCLILHRKHMSLTCLLRNTLALSLTTDTGVPYSEKYCFSTQSHTACAVILRTGKNETNLENPSTTTKIAMFPRFVLVSGAKNQ